MPAEAWPALRVDDWTSTRETLHMWAQVVGKVRLAKAPVVNHWWNVTLYVSPRGLTTSSIPDGERLFDIELDFCEHALVIRTSDWDERRVALRSMTVADFYGQVVEALDELHIEVRISTKPTEVEVAIPFGEDHQHTSYDPSAVRSFWQQLV